jgi:hypothetical protein
VVEDSNHSGQRKWYHRQTRSSFRSRPELRDHETQSEFQKPGETFASHESHYEVGADQDAGDAIGADLITEKREQMAVAGQPVHRHLHAKSQDATMTVVRRSGKAGGTVGMRKRHGNRVAGRRQSSDSCDGLVHHHRKPDVAGTDFAHET